MGLLIIDKNKCKKDGICARECPMVIIKLKDGNGFPEMVPGGEGICNYCGHCVAICPNGALSHANVPIEKSPSIDKELEQPVEKEKLRSGSIPICPSVRHPESPGSNGGRVAIKVFRVTNPVVTGVDPLAYPKCRGPMRVISFIEDEDVIKKILKHLGLWEAKPRPSPLMAKTQTLFTKPHRWKNSKGSK